MEKYSVRFTAGVAQSKHNFEPPRPPALGAAAAGGGGARPGQTAADPRRGALLPGAGRQRPTRGELKRFRMDGSRRFFQLYNQTSNSRKTRLYGVYLVQVP